MPKKFWVIFLIVGLIIAALFGGPAIWERIKPQPKYLIMGFFENGWSPMHGSSLPSLKRNSGMLDYVSPLWLTVKMDGSIEKKHNQKAMDIAREADIPVVVLINNEKDVIPNNDAMLTNAEARERSIAGIIEAVNKYDYDGINIDYEILPPEDRELLTYYVQELSRALHPRKKKVFVSVFPRRGVHYDLHGVYDYAALAEIADYIVVMAYNEHYPASNPGPIASAGWVKDNIEDALLDVDAKKILLGIATYGYDWPGAVAGTMETVDYIPMKEAARRAQENKIAVKWDNQSDEPYFNYYENDLKRAVWYENVESIKPKLKMAKDYGLSGIAIWRLGFEDNLLWDVIGEEFRRAGK